MVDDPSLNDCTKSYTRLEVVLVCYFYVIA